jgi:hypothetical protein
MICARPGANITKKGAKTTETWLSSSNHACLACPEHSPTAESCRCGLAEKRVAGYRCALKVSAGVYTSFAIRKHHQRSQSPTLKTIRARTQNLHVKPRALITLMLTRAVAMQRLAHPPLTVDQLTTSYCV